MIAESVFVLMTSFMSPSRNIYEHNTSEWNSFKSCEKARMVYEKQLEYLKRHVYYENHAVCLSKGDIKKDKKVSNESIIKN